MKSKFTYIIMFFITIFIIIGFGLFSVIIYQEITGEEEIAEAPKFQSDATQMADTIDHDIEVPKIIDNPLEKIEEVSSNNVEQVNYDNIEINKYFYEQLDEYSKTFYKAFESNKENMKTGTYKINLGSSFTSVLSKEDGQDELGKYYQSAIEAYTYDNPDIFYLSPNKMYLNIETTTRGNNKSYNVYIDCGEEANYFTDEFSTQIEVEQAISKVEKVRNQILSKRIGNTYEDIKMVHDYLVNNIEYDSTISEKNIYNIYGALVNGKCVCEGYAKSLKYLLDGLNIESTLVIGQGINSQGNTENHAWNYVKLNNNWYAIDSTWDDPVVIGGGVASSSSKYKYFLKGRSVFEADHIASGRFTEDGKIFTYPELSYYEY